MMALTSAPVTTRALLALAIASLAALGWTLLGPRPAPAVSAASTSTALPTYPASTTAVAVNAVNDADPAWARPIFFRDRKPHAVELGGAGDANGGGASAFDATLTGIVRSATLSAALLQKAGQQQSVRVRLGQDVPDAPGWRLVELTAKTARFQSGGEEKILKLEVARPDGAPPPPPQSADPVPNGGPMAGPPPPKNPAQTPADANATPQPQPQPVGAQGTPAQQQQVEAVRQRIEAARRAQQQSASSAKH